MFKPEDENINRSGRPKGSLNKSTIALAKVRESFADFVGFTFEQIQEDWQKLTPEQRVRYYIEFAKFCIKNVLWLIDRSNLQPFNIQQSNGQTFF